MITAKEDEEFQRHLNNIAELAPYVSAGLLAMQQSMESIVACIQKIKSTLEKMSEDNND